MYMPEWLVQHAAPHHPGQLDLSSHVGEIDQKRIFAYFLNLMTLM